MFVQGRSRSARSWYSAHTWPRSTRSLVTVFFAAPVIRTVARMLLPSTREPMICARFSVDSRFILTIMLEPGTEHKTNERIKLSGTLDAEQNDPYLAVNGRRPDR